MSLEDRSFLKRRVISDCGSPTEMSSELLDHHLKPIIKNDWSYFKDAGDFIKKTKNLSTIPENAILVAAGVVGL